MKQEIQKQGILVSQSRKNNATTMKSIQEYLESIQDTPTYACVICEYMQFGKDMYIIDNSILSYFSILTSASETKDIEINDQICKQCKNSICNGDLPPFASPYQIRRNKKIDHVSTLTPLEERLVAPRMAFAQIRQLGYKKDQIGLASTIINVLVNLDKIKLALPRYLSNFMTTAIMLKRKMEYMNAYLSSNIRPKNVMAALKYLCNTPLYKNKCILINNQWEHAFNKVINEHVNDLGNVEYHDLVDEDDDLEPIFETMIHGYGQTHVLDDLENIIIQIAPSEGFQSLGFSRRSFPKS